MVAVRGIRVFAQRPRQARSQKLTSLNGGGAERKHAK
jgi:hypothetical protein